MPTCVLACCNGVRKQTNHNEEAEVTLIDKLGNESAIAFLHTCQCSFDLIQQSPTFLYLPIESVSHHSVSPLTYLVANRMCHILNTGKIQKVFQNKRNFLPLSNSAKL